MALGHFQVPQGQPHRDRGETRGRLYLRNNSMWTTAGAIFSTTSAMKLYLWRKLLGSSCPENKAKTGHVKTLCSVLWSPETGTGEKKPKYTPGSLEPWTSEDKTPDLCPAAKVLGALKGTPTQVRGDTHALLLSFQWFRCKNTEPEAPADT